MNLLANGGFETNTTGWAATTNAEISRKTDVYHDGVASCKVTTDGVGAAEGFQLITGLPTVRAGEPYMVRGWIKGDADDGGTLNIIWREIGGSVIKTLVFTLTGSWQYFEAIGEADGSGNGTARIQVVTPTAQALDFWVDGLAFEPLPSAAAKIGLLR